MYDDIHDNQSVAPCKGFIDAAKVGHSHAGHRFRHEWIVWFYDDSVRDWPLRRGIIHASKRRTKNLAARFVGNQRKASCYAVMMRWSRNIRDPHADSDFIRFADFLQTEARWDHATHSVYWRTCLALSSPDGLSSILEHPFTRNRYLKAMNNTAVVKHFAAADELEKHSQAASREEG